MDKKALNEFQQEEAVRFMQIPGPNPILVPGGQSAWDEGIIEASNVFKDGNAYYLYYHARPKDKKAWPRTGYRLGVATALHPLGPWTKYEENPVIDLGPEGTWVEGHVACGAVIKEEENKYYMWYYGAREESNAVGLATASSPLGPWKKHPGNPVLEDFGYVGGVVRVNGKYHMYNEYPIGASSPDQGPMALATASKPEGPWEKYEGNPIIPAGEWGAWDDGGYSEAGVLYHDGVFHMFYGGTKWAKLESIGYAYSLDGYKFIKHSGNPIAPRENNPDASAFAEVHALWESPFYYLYHTLRYISSGDAFEEDIGVQILATETPFRLSMPVLSLDSLHGGATSELTACSPISLARVSEVTLTVEGTFSTEAKGGIRAHVRASCDGINYDTEDSYAFDVPESRGRIARKTVAIDCKAMFMKVIVENLNPEHDIAEVKVTATIGSS